MSLNKKLVVLVVILSILYFAVKSIKIKNEIISPFSNSVSIFSLFKFKEKPKKIVYGYLPWWSVDNIDYLQLDKLTDIAYFGFYLKSDGNFKKNLEDGKLEPGYNNWVDNKDLANFIKRCEKYNVRFAVTLVAHEDDVSDKFLSCRPCWETVANNLKAEMDKHNVKHLNLNFEYSAQTDKAKADQYADFTEFINNKMDGFYGDSFVVTSAFADSPNTDRITSNLDKLGKAADAIFIMGYDFHRPESANAGPVAPIDNGGFSIREMITQYLAHVPPNKLLLGVPYYGYNWVVKDYSPGSERIEGNDDIGFSESQSYAKIMEAIIEVDADVKWDNRGKTPYFTYLSPKTNSIRQVYFENKDSLREKYKLVKENDFAGIGIWALGYDGGYTELWDLLWEEFVQ